jgi:uroporphyrinogen decarboxylase
MNHRERLVTALNHQEPDRVPIDLGSTGITSIAVGAYQDLRQLLGLPLEDKPVLTDYVQRLARVDEPLLTHFDVDTRMVHPQARQEPHADREGDYWVIRDNWGARLRMPAQDGLYYDWFGFPLQGATVSGLDHFAWPRLYTDEELDALEDRARALFENTDHALVASIVFGGGIFEQPSRLMGMENFYVALLKNRCFADALMAHITDLYVAVCDQCLERIGQYVQVVAYWDDLAGQNQLLLSPRLYRDLLLPKQRRLVAAIRAKTRAKVFIHSCGAIRELIPDLIDAGFDIINPVQVSAARMDPAQLKREFGRDVVFWGGTVDPQSTLAFGTPDQVTAEARRAIDALAPGGGFVFSAIHNIQSFVPPRNVVALFEAAQRFGWY